MPLTGTGLIPSFLTGAYEPWNGKHRLTDVLVTVAGIAVSNVCHAVNVALEAEAIETTGYNDRCRSWMAGERGAV